jgi:hypothetical protein
MWRRESAAKQRRHEPGKNENGGGVWPGHSSKERGGSGDGTTRAGSRRSVVGTALPHEPEIGEVCGEAVGWGLTTVPWFQPGKLIQTRLNLFQINSNLIRSKNDLPELEKIEIKYGCEWFEERNHFLHSNFFRFEMYFELKIWEVKV